MYMLESIKDKGETKNISIHIIYNEKDIDIPTGKYNIIWHDINTYQIYNDVCKEKGYDNILNMLKSPDTPTKIEAYNDIKIDTYIQLSKILSSIQEVENSVIFVTYDNFMISEIENKINYDDEEIDTSYDKYTINKIYNDNLLAEVISVFFKDKYDIDIEGPYNLSANYFYKYDESTLSYGKRVYVIIGSSCRHMRLLDGTAINETLVCASLIDKIAEHKRELNLMISTYKGHHIIVSRLFTRKVIQKLNNLILAIPKSEDIRLYTSNLKNSIREIYKSHIKDVLQDENDNGITIHIPIIGNIMVYI